VKDENALGLDRLEQKENKWPRRLWHVNKTLKDNTLINKISFNNKNENLKGDK